MKDSAGEIAAEQPYALPPHSQQHIGVGALSAELEQARVEIKVRSGRVIVLEQSSAKALATLAPEVTLEQRVAAAKSRQAPRPQTATVAESLLLCPFEAAPFRDPATGLCFMRDRWYDPETGTFLTPDRSGYTDSSNLYAFGRNDPVDLSDPTGEAVPAVAYLGHVALQTSIDVGIDWAFHEAGDWWTGSHTTFDWHDSLETNFAINLASAGVGGKLKHLQKLRNPVLRKLATGGGEYGFDVAATGTVDVLLHGQSAGEAYGSAAVGGAVGRGLGYSFQRVNWNRAPTAARARLAASLAASREARASSRFREFACPPLLTRQSSIRGGIRAGCGPDALQAIHAGGRDARRGRWLDEQHLYTATSLSNAEADLIWARLSERYSAGASGEINPFIRGARPDRLFHATEFPILRSTGRVTKYIYRGWSY